MAKVSLHTELQALMSINRPNVCHRNGCSPVHNFTQGSTTSKAFAFMSDTTNIMKRARFSVQELIKNERPHYYNVGCISHLAELTVKAGLKVLLVDIKLINYLLIMMCFINSSKRKQEFCDLWCTLFSTEPQFILKHCPILDGYVSLDFGLIPLPVYNGLNSYCLYCDEQEAKVLGEIKTLTYSILSFILPSIDRFNGVFQKNTETTTCQLAL